MSIRSNYALESKAERPHHRFRADASLVDAQHSIYRLQSTIDEPTDYWRVDYLTSVTLLRAIGHVLRNVDAKAEPAINELLANQWHSRSQEPEFRWISECRNRLLKEYAFLHERELGVTWSRPNLDPNEADDATIEGYLPSACGNLTGLDDLWNVWSWWAEKLGWLSLELRATAPASPTSSASTHSAG